MKDGVHVRVKDDHRTATGPFAHSDQIARGVVMDVIQAIRAQQALDVFRALLFLARRRVDFSNRDPFAQNAFVISVDVVVCQLSVRAVRECLEPRSKYSVTVLT